MRASGIPDLPGPDATLEERLRFQAVACGALGSPLYAELLRRAADDCGAGGPTSAVLAGHEDDPGGSALVLRLMGAVHRLALDGTAPELAARYRSVDGEYELTWRVFRDVLERHSERLRSLVQRPVQTNEVGRCAALMPGFLAISAETGMPLRLLEVGASAGLNLRWSAYRYEADGFAWGPPDSPVRVDFEIEGGEMPARPDVAVAVRRGCDAAPIDPQTEEGRLTMLAYVWSDQAIRLERMRAAIAVARDVPATIERGSAAAWAAAELADPTAGQATVVYHSIVMQYLAEAERQAFEAALGEAGGRASREAPLAWLRMEPAGGHTEVRMTTWPGGEERLIATAGYHGTPVDLSPGER